MSMDNSSSANNKEPFKKCKTHSSMICSALHFDIKADQHYICSLCIKQKKIPYHQTVSISEIINFVPSPEMPIFPTPYNSNLLDLPQQEFNFDEEIRNYKRFIEEFFSLLQSQLLRMLAQQKMMVDQAKALVKKVESLLSEETEINTLRQILVSNDPNAEKLVHDYIKNQSSSKGKQILKNYDELIKMKSSFSLEGPERIQNQIKQLMEKIEFVHVKTEENILQNILQNKVTCKWELTTNSCLPSKLNDSENNLKITQDGNKIVINSKNCQTVWRQCYLTNSLKPKVKYIIRLSLNNQTKNYPLFYFGLVNNSLESVCGSISYSQYYGGGNTKRIKGKLLFSNEIQVGIIDLEFRICIEEQLFKVSSFPHCENVAELRDKALILPNQEYFFAVSIHISNEQVIINEVLEVFQFDDKM